MRKLELSLKMGDEWSLNVDGKFRGPKLGGPVLKKEWFMAMEIIGAEVNDRPTF